MKGSRGFTIVGPLLNPCDSGNVEFIKDGALACDDAGVITFVGHARGLPPPLASSRKVEATGVICPPFRDEHIHIPQHPIRGHFLDGVSAGSEHGRLIEGLNRNIFPAEARCADLACAQTCVEAFMRDTLSQGVVGGSAYMTVHEAATHVALERLGDGWSVGLVLMEMNCPDYLRVDPAKVEDQMRALIERFGRRYIVTDRFAVVVGSDLRRRAARLAWDNNLRTQTHLNEQLAEKRLVEEVLYPDCESYTEVYHRNGLLDARCLAAHCIHMTPRELELLARRQATVAHCPTSNTLLGSGIMPLDRVVGHEIRYRICTDVGASPTTSMLAEMAQFLKVHAGRSKLATPSEALYRAADDGFVEGTPMSFIEVEPFADYAANADDAILTGLLGITEADLHDPARREAYDALETIRLESGPTLDLLDRDIRSTADRLENRVMSVTLNGEEVFRRSGNTPI